MEGSPGELSLETNRVLPAPVSVVFAAFTEPDVLRRFWGPDGFTIPNVDFDPRVGESYRIEMQPLEGDAFFVAGTFRKVEPPVLLAFTFAWEDPDPDDVENLVVLTFHDLGEATKLTQRQRPFKTEARLALHRDGWSESFDKLERLLGERD